MLKLRPGLLERQVRLILSLIGLLQFSNADIGDLEQFVHEQSTSQAVVAAPIIPQLNPPQVNYRAALRNNVFDSSSTISLEDILESLIIQNELH